MPQSTRASSLTADQPMPVVWNTFWGGSATSGDGVVVDGNGDLITVGYGIGTWGDPINPHAGEDNGIGDALVAKFSRDGTLEWNTFLGSTFDDQGFGIAVDGFGNIYISGRSNATWGNPVHEHSGGYDTFVAKLSHDGILQWNTFVGSYGREQNLGIAADAAGNSYIVGDTDWGWGDPIREYSGGLDAYVVKLNTDGAIEWNTFLGSSNEDSAAGVAVDENGYLYVAGTSFSTWGYPNLPYQASDRAGFAAKLDANGAVVWNTFFGNDITWSRGLSIDNSGNMYVTGYSEGNWGNPIIGYSGGGDAYAARFDTNGILIWNTFLGSPDFDQGFAIANDDTGSVYVVGDNAAPWGNPLNSNPDGGRDVFVANLEMDGTLQWHTFIGSTTVDQGMGIAVGENDSIYVTGYSGGTWGDPIHAHPGDACVMFVAKLIFQEPTNQRIFVEPNEDNIHAWGWTAGTSLVTTIDDPATIGITDYTGTVMAAIDNDWDHGLALGGIFDIQPGHVVTVSGEGITKQIVVSRLAISDIDIDADTISGTGTPGSWIHVGTECDETGCANRNLIVDSTGNWMVDFSTPVDDPSQGMGTLDLRPGSDSHAYENDEDNDSTRVRWHVSNPRFSVLLTQNNVNGYEWPMGTSITLMIDDPSNGTGVDYSRTKTVDTENFRPPFDTWIGFTLVDFVIKPGDIVTMTDGTTTKTHITQEISVTNIDPVADTVSGTAAPGTDVGIGGVCDNNGCSYRNVPVDDSGHWLADFSVPGDQNNEQQLFDIQLGSSGDAQRIDEDGDGTVYKWKLGEPRIFALLGEQRVHAWGWFAGTPLTLTIDNPVTPQSPDYTGTQVATEIEEWDHGYDWGIPLDVQPGYRITVSGGGITKELIVAHLTVTSVDMEADTVTGTGDPGYEIHVGQLCDDNGCTRRNVYVDSNGNWLADFSVPGHDDDETVFDIRPGSGTGVYQIDEDGDATNVDWNLPYPPTFQVRANWDLVEGSGWILGDTVTIDVNDPFTPQEIDYSDTATVGVADWDPNQTWFSIQTNNYDLKAGDTVTVKDESITKQLLVTDFRITDVDLDTDRVYGKAEPGQYVHVWTCWHDIPCVNRDETADANGDWFSDFSIPGEQDWEQETANLQAESWIDSSVSDWDGDLVMSGWFVNNNSNPVANAGTDRIVYPGEAITLDASASFDPDGDLLTYAWDLDNDGQYDNASGVTASISFSQVGEHVIGVQVTDAGGLSDADTIIVTILPWTLKGFYQPVDLNGVYNVVKGGSTVPLKFEIFAGATEQTDILVVKSLTYAETACSLNAVTDEIELTATGSTSLRYDPIAGQFIYNWKTPRLPGKCLRVTVSALDGSKLVAYFKLK
ncbi:MAG TPA: PxKF domain-containing protein [Anaerolineales bacterium]|nr:PxKF domain-containing protein [Anaerolineales bacterium]